jgi:hypothetical protein
MLWLIIIIFNVHFQNKPKESNYLNVYNVVMGQFTEKDLWVNDVMGSLDGMQRIPASPQMYDRVMQRVSVAAGKGANSNGVLFKRVATAAILLFVINLASIIHFTHKVGDDPVQQGIYQAVNEEINYLSEDSY